MDQENPIHLRRWGVVFPAIGVVIAGAALWYGNFSGEEADSTNDIEIDQNNSNGDVNIGGDNNGIVNTGDINTGG